MVDGETKREGNEKEEAASDATTAALESILDYNYEENSDDENDSNEEYGIYTTPTTPNKETTTTAPLEEKASFVPAEVEITKTSDVAPVPTAADLRIDETTLTVEGDPPAIELREQAPTIIPVEGDLHLEEHLPTNKNSDISPAPTLKTKKRTSRRKKTTRSKPQRKQAVGSKKSSEDEELLRLALHRNPYFTCLDEEQIERFVEAAELVKDFRPGQAIITEGPSSTHIHRNRNRLRRRNSSKNNSNVMTRHKRRYSSKTRLKRRKTNIGDVYGDEYLDGAVVLDEKNKTAGPADVDDLFWDDDEGNNNQDYSEDDTKKPKTSSYVYIIRKGKADIFYESINPATLGPSNMFGEGGFLFGRNHSASVIAATDQLECFRVDRHTFVNHILPSQNMKRLYRKYATTGSTSPHPESSQSEKSTKDGPKANRKPTGKKTFMTMDDFLEFFKKERGVTSGGDETSANSSSLSPIANAYQSILRGTSSTYHDEKNHITLQDFCFFQFLMARPDPEIDIAFLLMDRSKSGQISRADFEEYLEQSVPYFDRKCEFVERHFGQNRVIRNHQFSQFLHDLQRELGKQAFLYKVQQIALDTAKSELEQNGTSVNKSMANPHVGYLPAETFIEVLKSTSSWRLPDGVIDRLESLYCKPSIDSAESTALASVRSGTIKGDSPKQVAEYSRRSVLADLERRRNKLGTRHFAYVDFIAFQDLLVQLPAICNLIERSCQIKKGPISPDDFKVANRVLGIGGRLSRQQVNIVFDLFDLDHDGYLSHEDAISVCGLDVGSNLLEAVEGRDGKPTFAPPPNYPPTAASLSSSFGYTDDGRLEENITLKEWMMTQTTQFLLSSVAGGFGIFTVYPLDLIKTRMMNQRAPSVNNKRLYQTSLDCLQKVLRYEGFPGLYRGLLPPLLAAGPEKFVKFTLNDMLRAVLSNDEYGSSSSTQWFTEIVSGGCAGACQLLVTNPLEIVKIRMQMQGETQKIFQDKGFRVPRGLGLHPMTFTEIFNGLGTKGLYKGAAACLMRDIPFGAIYFPAYAACMDYFVNREGSKGASSSNILLSGTLAAIPASLLTNPMDLVKTRLQVAYRPGEEVYAGIGDCFRRVHEKEGIAAFFKGSFPRVARIAPQFGLSLFAYEKLSQLIGFRGIVPPTNAPVNPRDYRMAFSNVSSGIESKAIDAESLIENIGLFKPPKPGQE